MSKIVYEGGNPFIEINGERIAPAAFRSFRPQPFNVAQFARMGVRLFQMLVSGRRNALGDMYSLYGPVWVGDHQYDFRAFDRQMAMFQKYAPNGYFLVMIQLDTPDWWLKAHPDCPDSFRNLSQTTVNSEWKQAAADYLQALITYAEEKYGDRIFAYSYACGLCTEWFCEDHGAPTAQKSAAYRAFCGDEAVQIPDLTAQEDGESCDLREPNGNALRYMNYCCQLNNALVSYFAAKAQEILHHEKLIGVFYGYLDQGTAFKQNLWFTNCYESVWADANIDMLFSPASYNDNRYFEGVPLYQYAIDSVSLNRKLYVHEIDHRTDLANYPLSTGHFMWDCYDTAEQSIAVLRRELCNLLLKKSAFWWFDFYGGYFTSPEYERELTHHVEIYQQALQTPRRQVAKIAVFVDAPSMNLMKERVDAVPECVRCNLTELVKSGAMIQTFNLSDLPRVDCAQYNLFVFLNALQMPQDIVAFIRTHLQDRYQCYIYAPGIAGEMPNPSRISEITGMEIAEVPAGDAPQVATYQGERFGFSKPITPSFAITDENAQILSRFADGTACIGQKGKMFYSAVGNVSYRVWQEMERIAQVPIYSDNGCYVAVDSEYVAYQNTKSESCVLHLQEDAVFEELFEGGTYRTENGTLTYSAPIGSTHLFRKIH